MHNKKILLLGLLGLSAGCVVTHVPPPIPEPSWELVRLERPGTVRDFCGPYFIPLDGDGPASRIFFQFKATSEKGVTIEGAHIAQIRITVISRPVTVPRFTLTGQGAEQRMWVFMNEHDARVVPCLPEPVE